MIQNISAAVLTTAAELFIIPWCEKCEKCDFLGGSSWLEENTNWVKNKQQRVFGTARVGDRGQIVIPKEAREFFGIEPGDTLLILGKSETGLIVSKPETLNNLANEIFQTIE